jgi:regulatory protein
MMADVTFQITQIEPQKYNSGRVNIYLDGSFAFGLDGETLLRHHLHEGDVISERTIDGILLVEERIRAKGKALALLRYRARSIKELDGRLRESHFSERTIKRVIEDFIRAGLLDDQKFASAFAQTKMLQKPVSKRLMKQELLSHGISETIADETLQEVFSEQSESEIAEELIRRRLKHQETIDMKTKKRLTDFLLRRGFDYNVIREALTKETGDLKSSDT